MKAWIYSGFGACCCFAMSLTITLMLCMRWKEMLDSAEGYNSE